MKKTLVLVGTKKGLFIAESDEKRRDWSLRGPYCEMWPVNHAIYDPASGQILVAAGGTWYGAAAWRSPDLGETWSHSSEGLHFGPDEGIQSLWSLAAANGTIFLGSEPAGLFKSTDGGATWTHVAGLRGHPLAEKWQPGGGGLILHSIAPDQTGRQLMVGISTGGAFYSGDGGETWEPRQDGLPRPDPNEFYFSCVHHLESRPGPYGRFFQQNHEGTFKSDDGGKTWVDVGAGIPSTFGFAAAVHPREPDTFYTFPLNGDFAGRYPIDGAAAVYRSRDAGATWETLRAGLPQQDCYFGVYRQAMATDTHEPAGVYFGTTLGNLFVSADEGDTWRQIAAYLPTIHSVETAVIDG
jgi:photosystem II stability/assembly factor-like uncharacterized protein